MPRSNFARANAAALVTLTAAFTACSDLVNPTGHSVSLSPHDLIPSDTNRIASITQVTLSSKILTIGGDGVTYTTTVISQLGGFGNYSLRAAIVQHQQRFPGVTQGIPCSFDKHDCTFPSQLYAPAGVTPGPALLELQLINNLRGNVLQTVDVGLTLASNQSITALTLNSARGDTILIEGSSIPYTASIQNTGLSVSGLSLQGRVVQGTAQRFAGGVPLACGAASGALPTGTCSMASQLTATNNTAGDGTLISGGATFELQLVDSTGHILATASVPLTLIEGPLTSPPPGPDFNFDRTSSVRFRLGRP